MSRSFSGRLLRWYAAHGRHDLPWQHPRSAYRVWVSEIMLQQTQVATVIDYFARFVERFPNLQALAHAPLDDVLALWAGLGYYSRARNLHRAADLCIERHGGDLPDSLAELAALPGIGRSTAGAILAQAHGQRVPILDGNAKRVLARFHGVRGDLSRPHAQRTLWRLSEDALPQQQLPDYTQALMDLGATLCTRRTPRCGDCPLHADCVARRDDLTAEIPATRRRTALPQRALYLLLVTDAQQRVLLVRRPPSGIWGGLWSLPEATDRDTAVRDAQDRYGLTLGGTRALPSIVHTFTHFRLTANPLHARLVRKASRVGDTPDHAFVARADAPRYGCPKPVARLLADYWSTISTAPETEP
jgi:A/G-specific adenine glycosylase